MCLPPPRVLSHLRTVLGSVAVGWSHWTLFYNCFTCDFFENCSDPKLPVRTIGQLFPKTINAWAWSTSRHTHHVYQESTMSHWSTIYPGLMRFGLRCRSLLRSSLAQPLGRWVVEDSPAELFAVDAPEAQPAPRRGSSVVESSTGVVEKKKPETPRSGKFSST